MVTKLGGLFVALLVLAGCTLVENTASPDTVRADLTARLDEARLSQAAALALWDRIIFGEIVSCQEAIPEPELVSLVASDLDAYPNARAVQDQLNAAIQAIHNSADLWNIECNTNRTVVPLSMAKAGRTAALAASAPLEAAAALLNEG